MENINRIDLVHLFKAGDMLVSCGSDTKSINGTNQDGGIAPFSAQVNGKNC